MKRARRAGEKLHFIVSCMGRLDFVKQTIEAAISQPNTTYTFVDYSCPQNSGQWVREHAPQANVVSVKDRKNWWPAEARNIGAKTIDSGWLCFLDSDILLDPEFSETVLGLIKSGVYLSAPQKPGIFGLLVCAKSDFDKIGGYDQILRPYGGEDVDLKMSLSRLGLENIELPERIIRHIDHPDELRTNLCDIKEKMFTELINGMYLFGKDIVLRNAPHSDSATLQRIYNYSKERFFAGYPWLSWPESARPPEAFPAILQTLASIAQDFQSISVEIWGGVHSFHIKRVEGSPIQELLSIYNRHQVIIEAPGKSSVNAMNLVGETYSIPLENGRAKIVLTSEPVFLLDEARLVKDIGITVTPALGPSVIVDLVPPDDVPRTVEMTVTIGELPPVRHKVTLAGAPVRFEIPAAVSDPARPRDVTVSITGNGLVQEVMRRTTFLSAAHVNEDQAASVRPPSDALCYQVGGQEAWVDIIAGSYHGLDDLHADVAWGWTDSALICWIARTDDVPLNGGWDSDGMQIGVQAGNIKAHFAPAYQFNLCWKDGASWVEFEKSHLDAPVVLQGALTSVQESSCRYMVVRLPFAMLGIVPAPGVAIGISLLFSDDDGEGRKGWLEWGGGIGRGKSPRLYNEIILGG